MDKTGHAYNNPEKCKSRELIVKTINAQIKEPVNMIEFLGDGTGLKYYAENIKNLNLVLGLERCIAAFNQWKESPEDLYDSLWGKRYVLRCSVENFVKENSNKRFKFYREMRSWRKQNYLKFNVVSLDFCTFFYDNNSPRSPLRTIEKVFSSDILSDNSLVIFTFMIQGHKILMHKGNMEILQTPETINTVLENMIEADGKYKVAEHLYDYEYDSCGKSVKTRMCNLFYLIDKVNINE